MPRIYVHQPTAIALDNDLVAFSTGPETIMMQSILILDTAPNSSREQIGAYR